MARGIVRMDDDDSARPRRDGLFEGVEINLPPMIVEQRIANQIYILNVRQETKERIARCRNQNFVGRIEE